VGDHHAPGDPVDHGTDQSWYHLDDTVELSQLEPAPAPDDLTVFPFLLLSLCRAEEDGSLASGRPRLGRNKG
jgi:hypothetical protein